MSGERKVQYTSLKEADKEKLLDLLRDIVGRMNHLSYAVKDTSKTRKERAEALIDHMDISDFRDKCLNALQAE